MIRNYLNNSIRSVVSSHKFNLLAGLASIIALIGWALETFVEWSGVNGIIGWLSSAVIILVFLMALMALVVFSRKHYALEMQISKNSKLLEHQHLNLQTLYHLRSALVRLQNLEQEVLDRMETISSKEALETFVELKEKDAAEILRNFANKSVNNTYKLAKAYFIAKGMDVENFRLTVKAVIPNDEQKLDNWLVKTVVRDSLTWQKINNDDESQAANSLDHRIGENTDFYEVINNNSLVYFCNDLQQQGPKYKNSSESWREHYNATMVVPISSQHKNSWIYYGFVAIDSLNKNKLEIFTGSKEDPLYQILKSLAEALAIWHIVYNSYINSIFKEHGLIQKAKDTCNEVRPATGEAQ